MSGSFACFCLLGWVGLSTESAPSLSVCSLGPSHLSRWLLEHPSTLEDSVLGAISITEVIRDLWLLAIKACLQEALAPAISFAPRGAGRDTQR